MAPTELVNRPLFTMFERLTVLLKVVLAVVRIPLNLLAPLHVFVSPKRVDEAEVPAEPFDAAVICPCAFTVREVSV